MVKWGAKGEMAKKNKKINRVHTTQMQMLKKNIRNNNLINL